MPRHAAFPRLGAFMLHACLAETLGTFLLVLFGVGSVQTAVLTGAQAGLWQVAIVWGVAVSMAVYSFGAVSGAHLNPALTLAFAVWRGFPRGRVAAYMASQLAGAILASVVLYVLFQGFLEHFEATRHIVRGAVGSEASAMVFAEYFPHPGIRAGVGGPLSLVSLPVAMLAEGLGTALLAFFIFALTDSENRGRPADTATGIFIGLCVSLLVSVIAPLTQAGLNPARDFGPRLVAYFLGWGSVAIPGPRGGFFTVYILAPILGGLTGGAAYERLVKPAHRAAMRAAQTASTGMTNEEEPMAKPVIILVGGFLGAGKTTLLWRAARHLVGRGKRVGLITNDQAPQLVDTAFLNRHGLHVGEISGGCFCCRFQDLVATADTLAARMRPHVLIGEPVGSCTDLSATVLQPLKDLYADRYAAAPFTVLVDPDRLLEIFGPGGDRRLHPSARYIVEKQLDEADRIAVNKTDLLAPEKLDRVRALLAARYPQTPTHYLCALTGQGVENWLDDVLAPRRQAGRTLACVDYDTYAEGEAVLGWLNATIRLDAETPQDWRAFCLDLARGFQDAIAARSAEIAHLKLLFTTDQGFHIVNLTRTAGVPFLQGVILGQPSGGNLILNARVEMPPDDLQRLTETTLLTRTPPGVRLSVLTMRSFSPQRPVPAHRYTRVVD